MTRFSVSILGLMAVLVCSGCELLQKDNSEDQAAELYKFVETYTDKREYDKAIEILQRITIDYESSSYAEKSEEEIEQYKQLRDLLLENEKREINDAFRRIGRALENYKARFLVYPLTPNDLKKLPAIVRPPKWQDVWGHTIYYKPLYSDPSVSADSPDGYALASFGMDGLPGGEGRDRDHMFETGQTVQRISN